MNECGHCSVKLGEEPALLANGKVWHVNHLLCDLCECRINDGERCVPQNGIILCFQCHIKTTRPICKGCGDFIKTNVCEALNSTWHPTCFQCSVCQKPLEVNFHQLPNKMCVHSECFWDLQLRMVVCKDLPK
ncbi:Protein CBG12788 [Caenorhabditis briggsae]|uniref:LIM zinc-binding domain-containing protein n=2 Tax=Caenorhabditis briggsae TaxID=6238 RepID=A0AAE9IZZ4_CAEBR|nr:Protein CBG12788 [Caenorhabditis briggsae]ULU13054.1 hypothetical protein L3Y34_015919 [Caenorhabditis briggsae]CAP31710.1 Protein CBG12788 [Caenorhabditis briggsae]